MTNFYTSDTHFYHSNIIKYCNRPFSSVEEMNEKMIANWNEVVNPGDTVYHLGDFAFCTSDRAISLLNRLNGRKVLITGNHEKTIIASEEARNKFERIYQYKEVKDGSEFLVLLHYGMRVWNKSHHGAIHLYGHSHGSLPGDSQSCDVGVDCWNFTPVTLKQIKERLITLPSRRSVDHHE